MMDWFDLLAVQGILKSLLQCYSSEASILWRSAFFMVHLGSDCTSQSFGVLVSASVLPMNIQD